MPVPLRHPPNPDVPLVVYQPANQPPANVVVVNNPAPPAPEPPCMQEQQLHPCMQQSYQFQRPDYPWQPQQQPYQFQRPDYPWQPQQPQCIADADMPQLFTPPDPDPNRTYWFRRYSGQWVMLTRFAIEQMNVRWYCRPNGAWYAVHA